jgi:26S proteasome regulatory subunit (ATPase 3-interacting protein)
MHSLVFQMNRPYGAVDVAANLKGAVPKATTQKILVALAEKGELVQKTYGKSYSAAYMRELMAFIEGKTTFFVANQTKIESMPPEKVATLEAEYKSIDDENKIATAELRTLNAGNERLLEIFSTNPPPSTDRVGQTEKQPD